MRPAATQSLATPNVQPKEFRPVTKMATTFDRMQFQWLHLNKMSVLQTSSVPKVMFLCQKLQQTNLF